MHLFTFMKCPHSHSWAWDSSCLQSCHITSSHRSGCHFFCEFNRSGIGTFALFPELWVIQCWKWYASCVATNRKIENCFLWYASTIPALLFNILSAELNQNVIFADYVSLISAWKWVWISSYSFWVLSEFWAKGKTVAVGKIAVAATDWQLFRCIKPFCLSADTLPVFSVDHHVLEYPDGYWQPVEERWASSPPRKGRNVVSNELSSRAIIYF